MRTALALGLLTAASSVCLAQNNAAVKPPSNASMYFSDAQLREIMQKAPGSFSTRLFADSTYSTAFIRLEKPDQPHAHGTWSEVFVVKEGSGILETGGTITGITGTDSATHKNLFIGADGKPAAPQPEAAASGGARRGAPGDLAGTAIEGGHQQHVTAGDVILIPAGVAHRWLQVDQPIVYLDTKFPKAE